MPGGSRDLWIGSGGLGHHAILVPRTSSEPAGAGATVSHAKHLLRLAVCCPPNAETLQSAQTLATCRAHRNVLVILVNFSRWCCKRVKLTA